MIGVTVMVKGTGTGAITDIDGKYSVSVPGNKSVLTFSFVGYTTKEVTVGNQKSINVTLSEDSKMIDEVVVIGFQSQKKGNLTASVASVGAETLENRPVANIGQALQGMVPGLNISIEGGDPNKVPSLNIRGATTFRQRGTSNDDKNKFDVKSGSPLILLDGVEITAEDLNQLNPNDIDNMSFLKDASAAAIYGTRATFGVILVATKGGNYNQKAKIDYSYNIAFDQPYELPDILDSYYIYKALRDKEVVFLSRSPGFYQFFLRIRIAYPLNGITFHEIRLVVRGIFHVSHHVIHHVPVMLGILGNGACPDLFIP